MAAGIALAALLPAACADEREQFRDDLLPLEERADERRSAVASVLRAVQLGDSKDARAVRERTEALAETYDEIERLDPPDDYGRPFGRYVAANDGLIRGLERFAGELEAADARGLRRASRAIARDLSASRSARLRWLE